jgi:hypothetical protein
VYTNIKIQSNLKTEREREREMSLSELKILCYAGLLRPRPMTLDEFNNVKLALHILLFVPRYQEGLGEMFRWTDNHPDDVDNQLRLGFVQLVGIVCMEVVMKTDLDWERHIGTIMGDLFVLKRVFDHPRMADFDYGRNEKFPTDIYDYIEDNPGPTLGLLIILNRINHSDFRPHADGFMPTHAYSHYIKSALRVNSLANKPNTERKDGVEEDEGAAIDREGAQLYCNLTLRELFYHRYAYKLSRAIRRDQGELSCNCGFSMMDYVKTLADQVILALDQSLHQTIGLPTGVLVRLMGFFWDYPDGYYVEVLKAITNIRNKKYKS